MPVCLLSYDQRQKIVLDKAITSFGRHPECDVVFSKSRKVSRKHCCIANVNNSLIIRDLGSTNGVRINSKPIKVEQTLRLGDQVAIGDLVFTLQDEASIKVKPSARPARQIEDDVILDEPTPLKPQAEDEDVQQRRDLRSEMFPVAVNDSSDELSEPPSALVPLVEENSLSVDEDEEDLVVLVEDVENMIKDDQDLESLTPPQKLLNLEDGDLVPLADDEDDQDYLRHKGEVTQPSDSQAGL